MSELDQASSLKRDIDRILETPMEVNLSNMQSLIHMLTRAHATLEVLSTSLDEAHGALYYHQNKEVYKPTFSSDYEELKDALELHKPHTDLYHREQRNDEVVTEHYYGLLEIQRRYFINKLGVNNGKSNNDC